MTDADELAAIRRRKREALEEKLRKGEGNQSALAGGETPAEPIHVTGPDHLNDLVTTHGVVLVDFHAEWCGPCKMLEPTVEALARESPAAVAKVDIDSLRSLATEYDVRGVPTLILFSGGRPVERIVGVRDQETLSAIVDRHAA